MESCARYINRYEMAQIVFRNMCCIHVNSSTHIMRIAFGTLGMDTWYVTIHYSQFDF